MGHDVDPRVRDEFDAFCDARNLKKGRSLQSALRLYMRLPTNAHSLISVGGEDAFVEWIRDVDSAEWATSLAVRLSEIEARKGESGDRGDSDCETA